MFNLFDDLSESETLQLQKRKEQMSTQLDYPLDDRVEAARRNFVRQRAERDFVLCLERCFTEQECQWILDRVGEYVRDYGWSKKRHVSFPTTDVPVKALSESVRCVIEKLVCDKVMAAIARETDFLNTDLYLVDLFVVKYESGQNGDTQKGLRTHTDGCLISFNVVLNEPSEFEGGGTQIKNSLYRPKRGGCIIHDAKLEHSGVPVLSGKRFIIVGFLESNRPCKEFHKGQDI